MTTLLVMAIGACLPYSPLAPALGLVPLPLLYWALLLLTLLCYVGLTQFIKTWLIRKAWV
jgi:Mg2+-importing ATPase